MQKNRWYRACLDRDACWRRNGPPRRATRNSSPGISKAALLHRPDDSGPAPYVGILVMHRTANYLAHRACTELSLAQLHASLRMNARFREQRRTLVDFEKLPLWA